MSYCVNCGVQLGKSEKVCPLCNTPVINPAEPYDDAAPRPYPRHIERINERIDRRYAAAFVSIMLLVPLFITIFTNLWVSGELSWSLYVVGALLLAFVFILLPLLYKKAHPIRSVLLDGAALSLYLLFINQFNSGHWYLPLGLPLALLTTALFLLCYMIFREASKLDAFQKAAALLAFAGIYVVGIEIFIDLYVGRILIPTWSFYALFPCLALSACLLILHRKAKLKEEIRKRFFI